MRRSLTFVIALTLVGAGASPAWAGAYWKERIDRIVAGRSMSVAVRNDGESLYLHDASNKRVPASNQKLLLSMALFDTLGPSFRIRTIAAALDAKPPVIEGDLWILGRGDPALTDGSSYARALPFKPTRIKKLAGRIDRAGVRRIDGRIMGSTTYFSHDWWAPGWKSDFPSEEVPLPSALAYEGNDIDGTHISDPEIRVARALKKRLEDRGVDVTGSASYGAAPSGTTVVADVESVPLKKLARRMNKKSLNFFAEELGKLLGAHSVSRPGTIAKGASAVEAWTADLGVTVRAYDSSGLSYENRAAAKGVARLLGHAEKSKWGPKLRKTLPAGGEGTLEDRLHHVRIRAKTGTLDEISTLSGWVWLQKTDEWAEFSIMSRGMEKSTASDLEDEIVRILTESAR